MKRLQIRYTSLIFAIALSAALVLAAGFFSASVLAEDVIPVGDAEALRTVVGNLNSSGGSATVELTADVDAGRTAIELSKGELTILGGDHKLTGYLQLDNEAQMSVGREGYDKTLQLTSNDNTSCVINAKDSSTLYMYDGTTIGPSTSGGTAGGVQLNGAAHFIMNGGTITDCVSSLSVAGGVFVDNSSVFDMNGGTITKCSGRQGGAVGVGGGRPIAGVVSGGATFNMNDGTISNSTEHYLGGGGICSFTAFPVNIKMTGGTIENCSAADDSYGLGGGVFIYATSADADIRLTSGTIKNNSAALGGGIFVYRGNVVISDGFGLHNNTATAGGDDIYNNAARVTLGTVDASATLESCGHKITDWYDDANERWSYKDCTGKDDYLELFTHTGELFTEEYGLKAAHGEVQKTYKITWRNDDGTLLEEDEVPEGETPVYKGATPTKEPTAEYRYEFDGWTETVVPAAGDKTYTAKFRSIPIDDPVDPVDPSGGGSVTPDDNDDTPATRPARRRPRVPAVPAPTAAAPAAAAPATEIADAETPAAAPEETTEPVVIEEEETPMAEQPEEKHWALLNLILAGLTAVGAAVQLLRKRKDHDDDYEYEDDEATTRGIRVSKAVGAVAAVASVIAFILTEDMSLPMAFVDGWTILMAALFGAQAVSAARTRKLTRQEYEEAEDE